MRIVWHSAVWARGPVGNEFAQSSHWDCCDPSGSVAARKTRSRTAGGTCREDGAAGGSVNADQVTAEGKDAQPALTLDPAKCKRFGQLAHSQLSAVGLLDARSGLPLHEESVSADRFLNRLLGVTIELQNRL